MTELDLNPAGAQLRVLIFTGHAVALQDHAMLTPAGDATLGRACPVPALLTGSVGFQRSYDKSPGRAPPVPRLGQRAVNAR